MNGDWGHTPIHPLPFLSDHLDIFSVAREGEDTISHTQRGLLQELPLAEGELSNGNHRLQDKSRKGYCRKFYVPRNKILSLNEKTHIAK